VEFWQVRKKSLAINGRIIEFFSMGEVEEKVYFEVLKDVLMSCQSPIDQKNAPQTWKPKGQVIDFCW
jgi:hypothetical protein